jgi:uncharacterized protein YciW
MRESGNAALAKAVASLNLEQLPERLPALARYAIKLTRTPRDIVDLNQVVAYFNYVNRIAEGLGVELEARWAKTPGFTAS